MHARTGGNPFYVTEVGRVLVERPDGLGEWPVPSGVRGSIRARLARLSPEAVGLLQAASVVGRDFPMTVVADMLEAPEASCLPLLDEAAAAGLVATSPYGDHRFVHDLVRDAVEAGLAAAERVRLHRSAAEAVERVHAGRLEPHLSDLARHWAVAAVSGERARAAEWIRRAADEAMRRLGYEEAARPVPPRADRRAPRTWTTTSRCRLLLAAAGALQGSGGALRPPAGLPGGRDAGPSSATSGPARRGGAGDGEWRGGPRVRDGGACLLRGGARPACLRSARELRAKVSANLSNACMYLGDLEAADRASAHALAMADGCDDRAAVAAAMRARQLVVSGPEGMDERAELADRMCALGSEAGDPATRMWGHLWRIDVAFERGDLAAASRELEPLARVSDGAAHAGGALAPAAGPGRARAGAGPVRRRTAAG